MRASFAEHYEHLWCQAFEIFRQNQCEGDRYLAGRELDRRRGLSLIARLPSSALNAIEPLLQRLSAAFPDHYVVPAGDLHVTLLSIEPVRDDFDPAQVEVPQLVRVLEAELGQATGFEVEFAGISASPQAVFACGYPLSEWMSECRDRVKQDLQGVGIGLGMDRRYVRRGAHATILRFVEDRLHPEQLKILEEMRTLSLGRHRLTTLQLVLGDWYTRAEHTQILWQASLS